MLSLRLLFVPLLARLSNNAWCCETDNDFIIHCRWCCCERRTWRQFHTAIGWCTCLQCESKNKKGSKIIINNFYNIVFTFCVKTVLHNQTFKNCIFHANYLHRMKASRVWRPLIQQMWWPFHLACLACCVMSLLTHWKWLCHTTGTEPD